MTIFCLKNDNLQNLPRIAQNHDVASPSPAVQGREIIHSPLPPSSPPIAVPPNSGVGICRQLAKITTNRRCREATNPQIRSHSSDLTAADASADAQQTLRVVGNRLPQITCPNRRRKRAGVSNRLKLNRPVVQTLRQRNGTAAPGSSASTAGADLNQHSRQE
jgi:hypothetical protein